MSPSTPICLALGLALFIGPAAASAQQGNAALFAQVLAEGDHVRLAAPGVAIERALVTRVTADSLEVAQDGQEWLLRSSAVQRLDVERTQTRRWAIRGAIAGLALGALSDLFISELCTTCGTSYGIAALRGALVVGGLGALIGSRTLRWEVVVP